MYRIKVRGVPARSGSRRVTVAATVVAASGVVAAVAAAPPARSSGPSDPVAGPTAAAGGPAQLRIGTQRGRVVRRLQGGDAGWPRWRTRPPLRPAPPRGSRAATRRPLTPRDIARGRLAASGWGGAEQWSCLDQLWTKESNWDVRADNPGSSAYGIPQALPGSKMATAGAAWRTDAATQITWGLRYIAAIYGSPCAAWRHSQLHNFY